MLHRRAIAGDGAELASGDLGRPWSQELVEEQPVFAVALSLNHGFDGAARSYVVGAVFRPARVHGRPVRVLVRMPIDFRLKDVR